MLDLANVWQIRGQPELGLQLQWQAFTAATTLHVRAQPLTSHVKAASHYGTGDVMSNMPIEFLIDNDVNNDIAMELLYLGGGLTAPHEFRP